MDESFFEHLAEEELGALERQLGTIDPDELEVELSHDVLAITLGDGTEIVINSHRAAQQIWMAAQRRAWHFSPRQQGNIWLWEAGADEFHATLQRILRACLGRDINIG